MLELCKPTKVFHFFEDICGIPHGSGNTKRISDYLVNFAKERRLKYIQDELGNVIIFKNASKGYEDEPAMILQGHMDMVAVSDAGYKGNMETDGLNLKTEGDFVYAEGTSLGGDDGIAVAMALALMDDDTLAHPALEVIFTVEEEMGMEGATGLDTSVLKGRRMINIDNEVEAQIIAGCAGGARADVVLKTDFSPMDEDSSVWSVKMTGCLGGHSGIEIDRDRINALYECGVILCKLNEEYGARLIRMDGGMADNAIPSEAELLVTVKNQCDICHQVESIVDDLRERHKISDPDVKVTCIRLETEKSFKAADVESTANTGLLITSLPNGIQAMSASVEGLVETSLNLGIIRTCDDCIELRYSVRSSIDDDKMKLVDRIKEISASFGADVSTSGIYPGWKYRDVSPLRELVVSTYEEMFNRKAEVLAIHAGLECGIFSGKIKDLDCISMGPDILDIHTTCEKLSISSTERVYEHLLRILSERIAD